MSIQITGEVTLIIERPSIDGSFCLSICENLGKALPTWGPSTRASPLFTTNTSITPPFKGKKEVQACFIGPIRPDELPLGLNIFLSYGLYNVVIFAQTPKERASLGEFLQKTNGTAWELWEIQGNKVISSKYSPALSKKHPPQDSSSIKTHGNELLRAASEEYQTLLAVTRARSNSYIREVAHELTILDTALAKNIQTTDLHSVRKLQWLININAALSRFSSQTFAGTSPILGTECHFWTHSLLGIGIATSALLQFRRYVDKRAALAQFPTRIAEFRNIPHSSKPLSTLPAADEWWGKTHLPAIPIGKEKRNVEELPVIVCFSGRDGFKSTTFTLSAPLEVLQSANTCAWSLHTITHELSHIFVDSIIAALIEVESDSRIWKERILSVYSGSTPAGNLLEQLQALLLFALARLEIEMENPGEHELQLTETSPSELLKKHYHSISELFAHIFDFLHFFQQDTGSYINSVWSSWDVIPSIESRVPEYIIRSLCALHISNLSVKQAIDVSIDSLLNGLDKLASSHGSKDQYITLAAKDLRKKQVAIPSRAREQIAANKTGSSFNVLT